MTKKPCALKLNFKINIGQVSIIRKLQENKTKKVFSLQGYAMDVKFTVLQQVAQRMPKIVNYCKITNSSGH